MKDAELGVGVRTVQSRRARYATQGLWGLVDQRATRTWEVTGRADPRLVEAALEVIAAEISASTGTRSRLMRHVVKRVEEIHGADVVPVPGRSAFYELLDRLTTGKHTFGSAVTRRQMANRPQGMFTPTSASRPGEQVQIDSTPIDVMVLLEDGVPGRADLTIAVDVATARSARRCCARSAPRRSTRRCCWPRWWCRSRRGRTGTPRCVWRDPARAAGHDRRADAGGRRAADDRPGHRRHRPRPRVRL